MGIYNITTVPESGTYTATQLAKGITFSISHDIPSNVSRSLSVYVKSTNGVTIVCKDNADSEDVYYDGKKISGTFVLVDTYTYESKGSGIKTVPVYRRKSEIR